MNPTLVDLQNMLYQNLSEYDISSLIQPPMQEYPLDGRVMMLMFARWIISSYGTPEYNVNGYDANWWKDRLEFFISTVYPNLEKNGSVKSTMEFLKS